MARTTAGAASLSSRNLYLFAVGAVAVAAVVRWLLGPLLADHLPFLTFYIAVAVTAWYGGLRPALLATALGFGSAFAFFVPSSPDPSLRQIVLAQWEDWVGYFIVTGVFAMFGEAKDEALNRAELRRETLQVTLLSIGDGVVVTDTEGRVTSLNPIAEALTGWKQRDAGGLPLEDVFQIVNEETRKAVESPVAKVLEHGRIVALANHTLLIAKDGTERPIDDSAAPIRAADGTLLGVVLIFRDVTEMRVAERSLRASEARKSAMLRTALDSIVTIDHDGKIVDFNPAAELMFGYRRDDVIGREMGEVIVPPALRESHRKGMRRYIATGEQHVLNRQLELTAMRSDGSEFPVELAITAIGDADQPMFTGYLRDISDRKQADDALRAAHGELEQRVQQRTAELTEASGFAQALLESLQTGIVACNAQGVLTLFNQATREFHGLPQESVPADQWAQHYDLYRPDGVTPLSKEEIPLFRALSGEHVRDVEMVIAPKRGKVRTVCTSGQSFYDGAGRHLGAVVSMHDITAGKQAAAALREAHDDLERRVAARTAELDAANSALQQADRRKDEFLATLAHELRNPLAPLRNGLQVMRLAGADADVVERARAMMERQLTQIIRLVDDLLDVNRISRGTFVLRIERANLADIVQHALETCTPPIEEKQHRLTVSLPPVPIYVDADSARLSQALSNLLVNAAKYTPNGGDITLDVHRAGGDAVITIKDSGVGIAKELLHEVFEMFTQADRSLETSHGGLGIGLSIVRRLVEMHGGTVEAKSAGLGRGSEFIVKLPVAVIQAQDFERINSLTTTAPTAGRRILIADDNEDAVESMAMMLNMMGNETRTAPDGLAALQVGESFAPEIVLLDIGMPKLNGYDAARRIRALPWGARLVLVALTGRSQDEDRRRSHEAGFDFHLVKPIEPAALEKLLAIVPSTLDSHRPASV
ncbi:MAG TPA: PAS domain S-box protein [Burkholderiaceae bacterium]|nr:PAS domain S-box protein [Burkholderiaceae bacterium]